MSALNAGKSMLLMLLLLLSPFLPLITFPASQASTNTTTTTQPNGQPLPPGTVSYSNNWTQLAPSTCPVTSLSSQKLVAQSNSWAINLEIPSVTFEGTTPSSFNRASYTVYGNGTLVASDAADDQLVLDSISGLPSGQVTSSFVANSTVAVQHYIVTSNGEVVANVSVTYSIKHQECMTTGLEITIRGSVDWAQSQGGTITIPLAKSPLRTTAHALWYGNQSGLEIGLDWSDSLALHPSLISSSRSLSYSVGTSFVIDPVIIVSNNYQTGPDYENYSCYSNGYFYVFYYYASAGYWVYTSSPNEVTWSSPYYASVENWGLSVWCSGNTVYYAADSSGQISWRYGVMNAGVITWAIPELLVANPGWNTGDPTIALNSTGGIFISDLMTMDIAKKHCGSCLRQLAVWRAGVHLLIRFYSCPAHQR